MTAQPLSISQPDGRIGSPGLQLMALKMKRLTAFAIALATSAILMTSAMAQNIGVSLAYSDDLFLDHSPRGYGAKGEGARGEDPV